MEPHDKLSQPFRPESIDEQIEQLTHSQERSDTDGISDGAPTIAVLREIYQEHDAMLERVRSRLEQREAEPLPVNALTAAHRTAREHRRRRRTWLSSLALVAAALIVLLNVLVFKTFLVGNQATLPPAAQRKLHCSFNADPDSLGINWSSRGKIAVISDGGHLQILDAATCQLVNTFTYPALANYWPVPLAAGVSWSPDGQRLLVERVGLGSILDGNTGKLLVSYAPNPATINNQRDTAVYSSAWSPDGKQIVSVVDTTSSPGATPTQSVRIWDARSGALVRTLTTGLHNATGADLSWSPNGQYIAFGMFASNGSGKHSVSVWDASTGHLVNRLDLKGDAGWSSNFEDQEKIAWSPDSERLATYSLDFLEVWNIPSGTKSFEVTGDAQPPDSVQLAWSPNGKDIVIADDTHMTIKLVDVATHKIRYTYPTQATGNRTIRAIAWSPDGSMLAIASDGVDTKTKRLTTTIRILGAR